MPGIRTGACRNVHDCSRVTSIFGAISRIICLELLHRIDRRLECNLAVRHIIEIDPIDHEIHGIFPLSGGIEGKRALAAQWRS